MEKKLRQYIVLGGKSPKNKLWVENVAKKISEELLAAGESWDYRHWHQNIEYDFFTERGLLLEKLESIKGEYIVVSKSIGAALVLSVFQDLINKPVGLHIFGLPKDEINKYQEELNNINASYNGLITVHQNNEDPAGRLEEIKLIFPDIAIHELKGDTHDYKIEDIISFLKEQVL